MNNTDRPAHASSNANIACNTLDDDTYDTEKIEHSLRSLIIKVAHHDPQIFKYYEKYDIHEKYIDVYEESFIRCEDIIEIIEVIKDMFTTLMNHVYKAAK